MGRDIVRALPSFAIALGVIVLTLFVARFAVSIADRLVGALEGAVAAQQQSRER